MTPPAMLTSAPVGLERKAKTEQRASMEAEEVKRTKQGMFAAAATGRKEEVMEISMMREETGGEQVEMKEGSRSAERRRASIWRKKGSEDGGKREGSRGLIGKSRRREDGREDKRRDSAADMVGRTARRETEMRRSESAQARRTKGTRWPMPELGRRRTRGRQIIARTIATKTMQGLHTVAQLRRFVLRGTRSGARGAVCPTRIEGVVVFLDTLAAGLARDGNFADSR
ncbi:hypothetical protein IEQ34_022968 [Dendrobium chrysotoxum]|uniref:Uncharacterized protein n=1 Tax=Dendrobium chrysotoxum TaxID=161865 RepID=A0AAV7G0J1_DENCH|nr:hypothetical protein IEQ34_022968 [Dendrobium chrysotoxum]